MVIMLLFYFFSQLLKKEKLTLSVIFKTGTVEKKAINYHC